MEQRENYERASRVYLRYTISKKQQKGVEDY